MRDPQRNARFSDILLAALLGTVIAWSHPAAAAEQRVALVIGNSAYPSSPLRNPVNDATAMAAKLRALGFEVTLRTNATQRDMNRAVVQFGQKLSSGSVGLFYYAGHGLQVRGKNFLLPVDAEIENEASVRSESVDVDQVLDQFTSTRLSMVILDACRNNPFERRFRGAASAGLAQIDAPKGTLIAYATAPGKTAADGAGTNGVYTENLLRAMDAPGIKVEDVFKQVRINVARATQDQQIPWEASSLTGEFYFRAPAAVPALAAPAAASAPGVDPALFEMAFWDSIKTSTHRADFEAYLEQYPTGRFAPLARNRLTTLPQSSAEPAQPRPSPPERIANNAESSRQTQEVEKMRAELLALRESTAPAISYAAEWAPRIAMVEKSTDDLTLSKALALMLDISAGEDLNRLQAYESQINRHAWNNGWAMGVSANGSLIWGGSYRSKNSEIAAQTAIEQCSSNADDGCKAIVVNGKFAKKEFLAMSRHLGRQAPTAVRQAFLSSLAKNPTVSRIGVGSGGNCSSEDCFSAGYASIR